VKGVKHRVSTSYVATVKRGFGQTQRWV